MMKTHTIIHKKRFIETYFLMSMVTHVCNLWFIRVARDGGIHFYWNSCVWILSRKRNLFQPWNIYIYSSSKEKAINFSLFYFSSIDKKLYVSCESKQTIRKCRWSGHVPIKWSINCLTIRIVLMNLDRISSSTHI